MSKKKRMKEKERFRIKLEMAIKAGDAVNRERDLRSEVKREI